MEGFTITKEQLNVLLKLVQELPLKTSINAYNTIQQVVKQPYTTPTPKPTQTQQPTAIETTPVLLSEDESNNVEKSKKELKKEAKRAKKEAKKEAKNHSH